MFISSTRLLHMDVSNILCKVVFVCKFQGSPVGVMEGSEASRGNLLQRVKPKNRRRKKP